MNTITNNYYQIKRKNGEKVEHLTSSRQLKHVKDEKTDSCNSKKRKASRSANNRLNSENPRAAYPPQPGMGYPSGPYGPQPMPMPYHPSMMMPQPPYSPYMAPVPPMYPCMHPPQPFMQAPPYPGFPMQPYGAPMGPSGEQPFGYPAPPLMFGGPHGMPPHFSQGLPQLGHEEEHEDGESEVFDEGEEDGVHIDDSCSADEFSSVASKLAQNEQQAGHVTRDAAEVDENESTQKRRMTMHNQFS